MNFELHDHMIRLPRYKVRAMQGRVPRERTFFSEEQKDAFIGELNRANDEALHEVHYEFADIDETLIIAYGPGQMYDRVIHHAGITHGEWAVYVFTLDDADYGSDPILIKRQGSTELPRAMVSQIRRVKLYPPDSPEQCLEYTPDGKGSLQIPGEEGIILMDREHPEISLSADISVIPEGTGRVTVEVEMYAEEFPLDPSPPPAAPVFTDIEVEDIDQTGYEWAEGETAETAGAAERLLRENKGRWKNREAFLFDRERGQRLETATRIAGSVIRSGVAVRTSKGVEHFSLTPEDQINIQNLALQAQTGLAAVLYHADGELCRPFAPEEITALLESAVGHVTYHQTYHNHLKAWIRRAGTMEELQGIEYGAPLPDDLAQSMAALLGGDPG